MKSLNRRESLKTLARYATGLAIASGISACGFKLRGMRTYPFKSIHLVLSQDTRFNAELRRALESQHIFMPKERREAEIVLEIQQEQSDKQVLTIDSGGRVREYKLAYTVTFSIFAQDGSVILGSTQLHQERTLSYSDNNVLAKQQEESSLIRSMEQDVVQQLLRRLSLLTLPNSQMQNADPRL